MFVQKLLNFCVSQIKVGNPVHKELARVKTFNRSCPSLLYENIKIQAGSELETLFCTVSTRKQVVELEEVIEGNLLGGMSLAEDAK